MENATARLRRFNRFFTHYVGALDPKFLGTDMSLAEARLLFEIAQRDRPLAADLQTALSMDGGFVSRVLSRFEARGWIERLRGAEDARQRPIALTEDGRQVAAELDRRQQEVVEASLDRLNDGQRVQLVQALTTLQSLLDPTAERGFTLRTFRAGDMGLIASRQSVVYREDYGWGPEIEVIEGEVTTNFLRNFKPGREQCWVAEVDGVIAGSVFLTDEGDGLCRLRLLYVESFARGLGVGRALVSACVSFARETGYREISLWTHSILETARRIYAEQGFTITETEMHERFGMPLMGETWVLTLRP
ncbi:bifunctional helix-turn-helix transcriptional regulator/GNAT family N-acetyltransferase [Acidisoma silvae]|uniref:MarR family transcriptional regulator n=1 Tax=Acidisoma silvae TaxID=2802396 RepID=A0A963YSZ1_9PROT|nr:helix-turn-helix domain-containing GNAT family N-acetyltransferase [Acidisoma silvae]MCB8876472.1 MarR family transcriptional regulator [Acidisoma silvae]